MAGQPVKRALVAQLERMAQEASEEREEPITALDVVYEYIASREGKIADLGMRCAKLAGIAVSERNVGAVLTMWIHGQDGGREMMERARADAAHVLAEEAIDLADDADLDKQSISKAKMQAEQRQWLASRWNRKAYGQDASANVQVNLNLGELHRQALEISKREQIEARATPALAPAAEGADYEVMGNEG